MSECFATVALAAVATCHASNGFSIKKNGPYTFGLEIAQNTLTLGESR